MWDPLYDQYSPVMYGVINSLTDDTAIAEKILKDAFFQLKETVIISINDPSFSHTLLKYIYSFTKQRLDQFGINPKKLDQSEEVRLINLLYTQCDSLKDVAFILSITEEEAKKKLRSEFLSLRNKNPYIDVHTNEDVLIDSLY
ncbi:MAG: hypothetical protein ACXVPU_10255 [Bacteroidia bacterium]